MQNLLPLISVISLFLKVHQCDHSTLGRGGVYFGLFSEIYEVVINMAYKMQCQVYVTTTSVTYLQIKDRIPVRVMVLELGSGSLVT